MSGAMEWNTEGLECGDVVIKAMLRVDVGWIAAYLDQPKLESTGIGQRRLGHVKS